jgi:glycosyltransferase involved in cell wall biosynthesis
MSKPKILILSYSNLDSDPRINRQLKALVDDYRIETSGYSASAYDIPFYPIYTPPAFSLVRKIKRTVQFLSGFFDLYYWDDGKKNVLNGLKKNKYDIIIANDINTLPLAIAIADNKAGIYFDAHEYHPKEFENSFMWRVFQKRYIMFLCKKYISQSHAFTTVSRAIAKEYHTTFGIEPKVINNATYFVNISPSKNKGTNIKLIHHGSAIPGRKLEYMIDMMEHVQERFTFYLMLTGQNTPYYKKLVARANKNKNIFFINPVSFDEIVTEINKYDVGIYLLHPGNFNNYFALPNKIFEFIQARLCLIVSPNPEMSDIVKRYDLGVVCDNFNPINMANALNNLTALQIEQYKNNSDKAASILNAEESMKSVRQIISDLINSKRN